MKMKVFGILSGVWLVIIGLWTLGILPIRIPLDLQTMCGSFLPVIGIATIFRSLEKS